MLVVDKPPGLLSVPGVGAVKSKENLTWILQEWARVMPNQLAAMVAKPSKFSSITVQERAAQLVDWASRLSDFPDITSRARRKRRKIAIQDGRLPIVASHALVALGRTGIPDDFAVYPRSVHRLDESTSGLLVFGFTSAMHRALSIQFLSRQIQKSYEALLDTRTCVHLNSALLSCDHGVITTPLQANSHLPLVNETDSGRTFHADACHAETHWTVLERGHNVVRVLLKPVTGRTHQLRLHCALPYPYGLSAPILGDVFYGDPRLVREEYRAALQQRAAPLGFEPGFATTLQLLSHHLPYYLPAASKCSFELPSIHLCVGRNPCEKIGRLHLHARELAIHDSFHLMQGRTAYTNGSNLSNGAGLSRPYDHFNVTGGSLRPHESGSSAAGSIPLCSILGYDIVALPENGSGWAPGHFTLQGGGPVNFAVGSPF